ncbi:hypothetical protein ACQVP2_34610 [Methylobacterium aquaticum]|uniref:hypothetical protein n=1 Tax=Methylobacterium aquaticum TaxID=270351 RepID=UPI003D173305
MSVVYHYTDTGRLPWIIKAGELRPGANRIGGYPNPDFLWATTSPVGDRTASASREALRSGLTRTVRFVLSAEDFIPWPQILGGYPAWTPDHIMRLEKAAAGLSSPTTWRCRAAALPRSAWLGIETRSYIDKRWLPLSLDEPVIEDGAALGLWIDHRLYVSERIESLSGATGYRVTVGTRKGAA